MVPVGVVPVGMWVVKNLVLHWGMGIIGRVETLSGYVVVVFVFVLL